MTALVAQAGSVISSVGVVLGSLDIDGYLRSNEMLSLVASLISALFAGLANAVVSGFFAGA